MTLLFAILCALLAVGSLAVSLWFGGMWLLGNCHAAEAIFPFVLGQIGFVFCGLIGLILHQAHTGSERFTHLIQWLVVALSAEAGMGLAGYAVYTEWIHGELREKGVATEAVVYRYEYSGHTEEGAMSADCYACYRFTAGDGSIYEGQTSFSIGASAANLPGNVRVGAGSPTSQHYKIGSRIPILYMSDNPECHMVNTDDQVWGNRLVLAVLSVVSFGISVYTVWYIRGARRF